jgi:formate/nitrite transporter FocA (FNT family)
VSPASSDGNCSLGSRIEEFYMYVVIGNVVVGLLATSLFTATLRLSKKR